jgi:hypothetical protein
MSVRKKLQVFVSSTFEDLVVERQAAVGAILKTGHIPAGMELFTAGDQSQMTTIQRWIDESDVYMLIMGGRYGSVEETSGLSYTELEYDYASMQGKPLFAVVIKEDALEEKRRNERISCLERKNPEKLSAFRKKVLSNMSSFFGDEKDIRLSVYESLSELAATRDMKGWVSAEEVVDNNLLHKELQELRSENSNLKNEISKSSISRPQDVKSSIIAEIQKTISSIEVIIPEKISKKADSRNSLMNIFYIFRERFTTGIYNRASMSDLDRFLYFNVGGKLHVHGLVDTEKVANVTYRRMFATKLGLEILAKFDRAVANGEIVMKPSNAAGSPPVTEEHVALSRETFTRLPGNNDVSEEQ